MFRKINTTKNCFINILGLNGYLITEVSIFTTCLINRSILTTEV